MIADDQQLEVTLERIGWFQKQVAHLRRIETNAANYRASAAGFLAEIDRMQREVPGGSAPAKPGLTHPTARTRRGWTTDANKS